MDGLSFLEKIMRLRPTPVIMVSTLTSRARTRPSRRWSSAPSTASPSRRRATILRSPNSPHKVRMAARAQPRLQREPSRLRSRRVGSRLQTRHSARGHRRLDRRRRGPDRDALALSRQLPADRDHPAHARALHQVVRAAPGPRERRTRLGSRRWRRDCDPGASTWRPGEVRTSRSRPRMRCAAGCARAASSTATARRWTRLFTSVAKAAAPMLSA